MVYARMDRTGDIFSIRRTQLTFAENAGLSTLLDRFVSPVVVATLSQVRVTTADGEDDLRIEYENGDDNIGQRWFWDENAVTRDEFTDAYLSIIALQFDQTAPRKPQALPCWRMSPSPCATAAPSTVRYEACDAFYALATTDGGGRFLVRLTDVENMLTVLKACKEKVKPQIGLAARKFGRRWGERSAAQISHHKVPA